MNSSVKDAIKKVYYSRFGRLIRFVPERIILKRRCYECNKNLKLIDEKKDKNKRIRVVFILEYPEIWNSSLSIFEYLNTSDRTEAFIIALPKYPKTEPNEAYVKTNLKYSNVINGYDQESASWFDLRSFAPDYVFYTRPYAVEYPDNMKPQVVSKYAKLCYLTYGFDFTFGYHIEVSYNLKMMPYMHMIFCDGISSLSYCKKLFNSESQNKKIYDIGYPRFDLLFRLKLTMPSKDKIRTILWTPRWSLERLANDGSSYFDFINILISFFSLVENRDINLIIRPHPLMFDNFVKNKVMTQHDVDVIHDRVSKTTNIRFDQEPDYLISACQADLVIADFTSLIIEYLMLDIPVLYCGSSSKFDEVGHMLDECMYHLSDYSSIIDAIKSIIEKGDTIQDRRRRIMNKISKGFDGKIGERISKEIIKDFEQ